MMDQRGPAEITLRPVGVADRAFLRGLYASTRAEEMALAGWSLDEIAAFLEMQFEAQDRYYRQQFSGARFAVIEAAGVPIGRLYVDRRTDEIRVIDIALLPAERGRGIGGMLMRGILAEAAAAGLPVRIHVERWSRALSLYRRLGFRPIADQGVYWLMERPPRALVEDRLELHALGVGADRDQEEVEVAEVGVVEAINPLWRHDLARDTEQQGEGPAAFNRLAQWVGFDQTSPDLALAQPEGEVLIDERAESVEVGQRVHRAAALSRGTSPKQAGSGSASLRGRPRWAGGE